MNEVVMPKLGLTRETGVIEKWHKKEGNKIDAGEVLFEVMTDKVSFEVKTGNDILDIRKKYPSLQIFGGINKYELSKGKKYIDKEIKKVGEI